MKKAYLLTASIALLIGALIAVISIGARRPAKVAITTVPKDHMCLIERGEVACYQVLTYTTQKKTFLVDKKALERAALVSGSETLPIEITDFDYLGSEKIAAKTYYKQLITFRLDFTPQESLALGQAVLECHYRSDRVLRLPIGPLGCFIKNQENGQAYFSALKGVTNDIGEEKVLVGIVAKFGGAGTITALTPLTPSYRAGKAVALTAPVAQDTPFMELTGHDYGEEDAFEPITAPGEYFIPLYKKAAYVINELSFEVSYTAGETTFNFYCADFLFFKDYSPGLPPTAVTFYSYENR